MAIELETYQEPTIVRLSDEERTTGKLSDENIALGVLGFNRDGLVIVENAVDTRLCDKLDEIMQKEADELLKDPKATWNDAIGAPAEKRCGNISQKPPLKPEFMYEDFWANKAGLTILSAIMGPNPVCNFVDGNTALAMGFSGRQSVHGDLAWNFPPGIAHAVSFNYYLQDASKANGSTELWLGSARTSTFRDHKSCRELREGDDPLNPVRIDLHAAQKEGENAYEDGHGVRNVCLDERRKWAPPIQPVVKKGSLMMRDLRTWHAGIANPSNRHRVMLNFVHTPYWYKCPTTIVLPENTRSLVESWGTREVAPVRFQVRYVTDEQTARDAKFGVDFTSRNPSVWKQVPKGLIPGFTFQAGAADVRPH